MRPGISVQHTSHPSRRTGLVQCDVTALLGFITKDRWPEGASSGDFVKLSMERPADFWDSPLRLLASEAVVYGVRLFFENGGEVLHVFLVCVEEEYDLYTEAATHGALAPLLERLRAEEDISLLVVPEAAFMPCRMDRRGTVHCAAEPLWDTLLRHCREMTNRFLILDTPRGLHAEPLLRWMESFTSRDLDARSYGAIYYPWVYVRDHHTPPSAGVAGIYARVERAHGPFGIVWPPANIQMKGINRLEVELDFNETAGLAAASVNPLVAQAGRGVMVWGARTLCRDGGYAYVNSRRLVSMVTEQLRRDNEWAVFEPNDERAWMILQRDIRVRLEEFWRAGLLTGETRHGDYEVKVDHETNPPEEREDGRLNVQVRLRPIGMTEHITIDLRLGEGPG